MYLTHPKAKISISEPQTAHYLFEILNLRFFTPKMGQKSEFLDSHTKILHPKGKSGAKPYTSVQNEAKRDIRANVFAMPDGENIGADGNMI